MSRAEPPATAAVAVRNRITGLAATGQGYRSGMSLALLLIIIGIVLAILVHYALGIVCVLIGLVLLIWPRISAGRGARV